MYPLEELKVREGSYERLPWSTFDDVLTRNKLKVKNWPAGIAWPPGKGGRKDRGIEERRSTEVLLLHDALFHPQNPLIIVPQSSQTD